MGVPGPGEGWEETHGCLDIIGRVSTSHHRDSRIEFLLLLEAGSGGEWREWCPGRSGELRVGERNKGREAAEGARCQEGRREPYVGEQRQSQERLTPAAVKINVVGAPFNPRLAFVFILFSLNS